MRIIVTLFFDDLIYDPPNNTFILASNIVNKHLLSFEYAFLMIHKSRVK